MYTLKHYKKETILVLKVEYLQDLFLRHYTNFLVKHEVR